MRRSDEQAPADTATDRRLEAFLGELARALKAATFYPRAHPALQGATDRAHRALCSLFSESGGVAAPDVLELSVGRRGFVLAERAVADSVGGVADLAHECLVRRVSRLFFRLTATADDLAQLLSVLTIDPDGLAAAGGIERRLAAAGVRAIWANEADLDAMLERLSRTALPPESNEMPLASPEPEPEAAEQEPEEQSAEAALLALLARLERETDSVAYQETIDQLRPRALEVRRAGDFARLLPTHVVLAQHAAGTGSRRAAAARQMADTLLAELVDNETLAWLAERVGTREARGERELLGGVLVRVGARALTALLDVLSIVEDWQARRALSQVITLFGEGAVPELEMRLRDGRWYVVRNMASLLGELRNQGPVPALAELLAHEDRRVRRAALQALAKIGGPMATAQVVRCLANGDPELQVQAILAVGAWREPTALPALQAIAQGSDPGHGGRRHPDPEIRRYAIEALGLIGGSRAFRVLSDLLEGGGFRRRVFGRKEGDLIRIAAAEALAGLGGPEVRRRLLTVAGNRTGAVADRCRELAAMLR